MSQKHVRGNVGRIGVCLTALITVTACSDDESPSDSPTGSSDETVLFPNGSLVGAGGADTSPASTP
jgi:hypothetical protein